MIIRELQGVMVHSVLSGPKTPIRAIMGTTTATLLRPMAQALGGAITDFNGPQMREGLASLNAMREALPEAFKLFGLGLTATGLVISQQLRQRTLILLNVIRTGKQSVKSCD